MLMNIASAHQTSSALIEAGAEATKQQIEHIERNQVAHIDSTVKDGLSNVQVVMETVQRSIHEGRVDAVNSYQHSNVQLSRIQSQLSGLEDLARTIAENSLQPCKGAAAIEAINRFRKGSDESGIIERREEYLIRV